MITRRWIATLVTAACLLPISLVVVLAVARLLAAMDDSAGAAALDRIALGLGILWIVNLVTLLIVLAIRALETPPGADE